MLSGRIFKTLFVCIISVSLISCGKKKTGQQDQGRMGNIIANIEGFVVRPSNLDQTISVSGTLKPFEETNLMPEMSGRVVAINLEEGKFVRQGSLLVKIFDEDLQAQLHKAQAQLLIAQQISERQGELVKVNGISQTDFDQSVLQVNSIKADIEVLKAQIRKSEIRAPYDGVIGLRNISIGAQVTPGTSVAIIRSEKQLKLDFSVPEKYSAQVRPGTKIYFTIQSETRKFEASVMATEEGIDASTRVLKVRSLVNVDTPSLLPGTFATVEVALKQEKGALMIPTQSIIPREKDKQLIVAKAGKAKFMTVITSVRQDSMIEVVRGLNPGDTVVTTGILFIKTGSNLKFSRVK
ncbi:MAG TPA: efflux RND transporter periplasmic adaptor subunit [Bacteroidales bacterium]|nr:efflux RND transporter periplasmic adaptor subunit [Bacteroidales bacterium]